MPRPRTTKTTYPGLLGPRTRYVHTDAKGNRQITHVNSGFTLAGDAIKAFFAALLAFVLVAALVVLAVVALIGLATHNKTMKQGPTAAVGALGRAMRGLIS